MDRKGDGAVAPERRPGSARQDPGLWRARGLALARQGRMDEADQAFARFFALSPEHAGLAEAVDLQRRGEIDLALAAYQALLADAPEQVDALRLCAVALAQKGRLDEAEALLRRCLALAPDFVFAWNNLGSVLYELDHLPQSVAAFRKAVDLAPQDGHSHFNLGNALAAANDHDGAQGAYDRALERLPNHPGALIGKGHVLKTIGRQADAVAAYRACLAARPDYGEVWWSLANLKTYRFSDEELSSMHRLVEQPELAPESRISTQFALAKAYEDRGDYARAFALYVEGNAAQRSRVAYDPVQTETLNDRLIALIDADFLRARRDWGCADPSPIFIVGLPRSGSTLIEQILASHSLVDGTSELPNLGQLAMATGKYRSDGIGYPETLLDLEPADFEALGRAYIAQTRCQRGNAPRFTDKMPNNFPTIGFLKLILPNAKIIDARRHPLDSCMGSFKQLFAKGQTFTYDLFELAEYYLQYARMMRHWDQVLPHAVLRVDYEALLADQEQQTRRILDYCDLPFEDACLAFHRTARAVKTASSEQVRQPVYTSSLQSWRRFAPFLSDLERHLAPVLEDLPAHVRYARR